MCMYIYVYINMYIYIVIYVVDIVESIICCNCYTRNSKSTTAKTLTLNCCNDMTYCNPFRKQNISQSTQIPYHWNTSKLRLFHHIIQQQNTRKSHTFKTISNLQILGKGWVFELHPSCTFSHAEIALLWAGTWSCSRLCSKCKAGLEKDKACKLLTNRVKLSILSSLMMKPQVI